MWIHCFSVWDLDRVFRISDIATRALTQQRWEESDRKWKSSTYDFSLSLINLVWIKRKLLDRMSSVKGRQTDSKKAKMMTKIA
jgi:hypothetical protein